MDIELARRALLLFDNQYCRGCGIHYTTGESHDFDCSGQLISDAIEDIKNDFKRASGDSSCHACGKIYYKHPLDQNIRDNVGNSFLHVLCGGQRVKL